ncbi:MAG: hypothetical protein ACOCWQ_06410 [Nanoarchaeota archaeon]
MQNKNRTGVLLPFSQEDLMCSAVTDLFVAFNDMYAGSGLYEQPMPVIYGWFDWVRGQVMGPHESERDNLLFGLRKSRAVPHTLELDGCIRHLDGRPYDAVPRTGSGFNVIDKGAAMITKYAVPEYQAMLRRQFDESFGVVADQDAGLWDVSMLEFFLQRMPYLTGEEVGRWQETRGEYG